MLCNTLGVLFMHSLVDFLEKARELNSKRDELVKEFEDFLIELIFFLKNNAKLKEFPITGYYRFEGDIDNTPFVEGILIDGDHVYYIDVDEDVKVELEDADSIRSALRDIYGENLILNEDLIDIIEEIIGAVKV